MMRAIKAVSLFALFFDSGVSNAGVHMPNHFFYQELADLDGLVLVRGAITKAIPDDPSELNDADKSFEFKVAAVLYGKQVSPDEQIDFDHATVGWPDTLVPFERDAEMLLLLRRVKTTKSAVGIAPPPQKNAWYICGVLPTSDIKEEAAHDRKQIVANVKRHLHPLLEKESDSERLRELILLLAGIVDETDVRLLASFVEHKDEWVARAAKAALVRADASGKHLEMAASDLKALLPKVTDDHRTERTYGARTPEWSTSGLIFTHYHYLYYESAEMNQRFLPLSRVIAAASQEKHFRIYYGILAVCKYGTPDDAAIVRGFASHDDEKVRAAVQQALLRWSQPGKKSAPLAPPTAAEN